MTDKNDPSAPDVTSGAMDAKTLNMLMQNPLTFILLLMVLGGQGADLFASNNYTSELRELRADVTQALTEITDNSERIGRLETRLDRMREDASHERERLSSAIDRLHLKLEQVEGVVEGIVEDVGE